MTTNFFDRPEVPWGFTHIDDELPPENHPVIALRRSGYVCTTNELITVRYMPTYRPTNPWRDLSDEGVGASGEAVFAWRTADSILLPATCSVA